MEKQITIGHLGLVALIAFALGVVVGAVGHSKFAPCVIVPTISVTHDTIVKRDTINGIITKPVIRTTIRRDTLLLPSKPDTSHSDTSAARVLPSGGISIPIEQRVYQTDTYRAVVSGWHPSLDTLTLFEKTMLINTTVTKQATPPRKNWALVVGPSVGYGTTKAPIFGASVVYGFVIR